MTDVVIAFTDRRTSLAGAIRDASGRLDPTAGAVVFPADYVTWIENGAPPMASWAVPATSAGTYEVSDLRPGTYLVAPVPGERPSSWPETTAIYAVVPSRLSGATRSTWI